MLRIAPDRLLRDQTLLLAGPSPVTDAANSLFTFMAQRFVASYNILGCAALVDIPDPVSFTQDANGVAISATIDLSNYEKCKKKLDRYKTLDDEADDAERAEDASD